MDDIRNGTCPLCQHTEIIASWPQGVSQQHGAASLMLTHERRFIGVDSFGVLCACTCRRCGYTQLFAAKPGEVPIGPEHKTSLLTPPHPAPFR